MNHVFGRAAQVLVSTLSLSQILWATLLEWPVEGGRAREAEPILAQAISTLWFTLV